MLLPTSKSNQHELLKDARRAGTARTDEEQTFKKPFQTVGRPQTMRHNMHDDFVHDPPKNIAKSEVAPHSNHKLEWAGQQKTDIRPEILGHEELSRIKHSEVESELIAEDSVHS